MALSGISPITNSDPGLALLNQPVAVAPSSARPAAAVSKAAPTASSQIPPSAPAASTPKAPVSHGGGGSAIQELITDTYTTTVGGKTYTGSVQQEPGGQYVASVPNLPGAAASGSSIEAAEDALGSIIDALA